jgi:hypothetical protein
MIEHAILVVGLTELFLVAVESQLKRGAFGLRVSEKSDFGVILRYLSSTHKFEAEKSGVKVD